MNLHLDQDAFATILDNVAKSEGIRSDILEKDYYVTLMLKELAVIQNEIKAYFKGGTALYKALSSINRFSEDIDLTVCVEDCESLTQAKRRLERSAKGYGSLLRLNGDPDNQTLKGSVTTIYGYQSIFNEVSDHLQRFGRVKVEATSFTVSEPVESVQIAPVIYQQATEEQRKILTDEFNVAPFHLLTIKLERIFVDKIFATEYYYLRYKSYSPKNELVLNNFAIDVAKHIYDLMILYKNDKIKTLLENEQELNYLFTLKRLEELGRKGGILESLMISDFSYINKLLDDEEFKIEYSRMQDIYVFKDEDKILLEEAIHVISAIRRMVG